MQEYMATSQTQAQKAVDGFMYMDLDRGSCAVTLHKDDVYWSVDLGHIYEVDRVVSYIPEDQDTGIIV